MQSKPHHGPLSNEWVLFSFLLILIAVSIWRLSTSWAFILVLFGVIIFFATIISAVRAPLQNDDEMELAVHEKYGTGKYPDTDLHEGNIPQRKKYLHSKHKKILVQQELVAVATRAKATKAKRKAVNATKKKVVKKPFTWSIARKKKR